MMLISLQVFKPKLKSKSYDINKSFKFNPKTLSHYLAKYKIKVKSYKNLKNTETFVDCNGLRDDQLSG